MSTPTKGARPGRRLLFSGITLMLLALITGVWAIVEIAVTAGTPFVHAFTDDAYPTPGVAMLNLDEGKYVLYGQTNVGFGSPAPTPSLGLDQVKIIGPDGSAVADYRVASGSMLTRGTIEYLPAVGFLASQRGSYRITVTGGQPATMLVAQDFVSAFNRATGWWRALEASVAGFLLGVVLLIIGLARRPRKPPQQFGYPTYGYPPQGYPGQGYPVQQHPGQGYPVQEYPARQNPGQGYPARQNPGQGYPAQQHPGPTGLPVAGWYADPERPGQWRWWDGQSWHG